MPSGDAAAIIAGASAVAGGAIVAVSNYAVGLLQAREARRTEMRRALIEFGYVVYRIDHLLRTEPTGGKTVRFVNEQLARLPQIDYTIGLARRRLFEPYLDGFVVEMSRALTTASMLAPLKLLPSMEALTDAMSSVDQRDDAWRQRWNAARTSYFVECRKLLGSGVIEPQDSPTNRSAGGRRR
jgi:hypothetical protein